MSERSYQQNRRLGVTGYLTHTCHIAAIDRLANSDISPQTYLDYDRYVRRRTLTPAMSQKEFNRIYSRVAEDLSISVRDDIVMERLASARTFSRVMHEMFAAHMIVVANLDLTEPDSPKPDAFSHSVGIIPISAKRVVLRSTWLPAYLYGPQTLPDIYPLLEQPGSDRYFNVVSLDE